MIEVEIKVAVKEKNRLEVRLQEIGFLQGDQFRETDFYFDSQSGDIRKSDGALRIRKSENLTKNTSECFLTFKGPKLDRISMTRREMETGIECAETGTEILKSLGYEHIYPVSKHRHYFYQEAITACMDQVDGLGDFLELEMIISKENEREAALEKILLLLKELGYEQEDIIRTSYLSMLQSK